MESLCKEVMYFCFQMELLLLNCKLSWEKQDMYTYFCQKTTMEDPLNTFCHKSVCTFSV